MWDYITIKSININHNTAHIYLITALKVKETQLFYIIAKHQNYPNHHKQPSYKL